MGEEERRLWLASAFVYEQQLKQDQDQAQYEAKHREAMLDLKVWVIKQVVLVLLFVLSLITLGIVAQATMSMNVDSASETLKTLQAVLKAIFGAS